LIGTTLKHYMVEEPLGKGGMGVVYRALDTRLQRKVALKILPEEFTANTDRRRRFQREARAAAAVTHPAIAQIHDVDEVDGVTFIVMELVEGRTVASLISAG
jgi:serine/threonine protein kinase